MFLTNEERQELTGRKHRTAQVETLRSMGVEHRLRSDGSIVILKSHIEKLFDGVVKTANNTETTFKLGEVP